MRATAIDFSSSITATEYVVHLWIYRACKSSFILSVLCGAQRNTNEALARTGWGKMMKKKRNKHDTCVSSSQVSVRRWLCHCAKHCKCIFTLYNAMNLVNFNAISGLPGCSTLDGQPNWKFPFFSPNFQKQTDLDRVFETSPIEIFLKSPKMDNWSYARSYVHVVSTLWPPKMPAEKY